MWLRQLRDKLWNIIRWDIEDKAWWSNCDAKVLHGVGGKCAEGGRILGYQVSDPLENRDVQYYKEFIAAVSRTVRSALDRWEVLDCSITKALVPFEDAARRVRGCSPNLTDGVPETALVRPAHLANPAAPANS